MRPSSKTDEIWPNTFDGVAVFILKMITDTQNISFVSKTVKFRSARTGRNNRASDEADQHIPSGLFALRC